MTLNGAGTGIIDPFSSGPPDAWTMTSRGFNTNDRTFGGFVGDFNGDGITDVVRNTTGQFSY